MGTFITAILVFGLLVIFHELGHFIAAKLAGVKVHEFAVGMGPRFLKIKGKETEYSLRILPIGGYVKMEGEDESSEDERSFGNKPLWARMSVIVAGPLMNFILAVLLFIIIFYAIGFPTTKISQVTPGLPAEAAGIEAGDQILRIDGKTIDSWDEIVQIINSSNNRLLHIALISPKGEEKEVQVQPVMKAGMKQAVIGISPVIEKSFPRSVKASFNRTIFVMQGMLDFLGNLFRGKASAEDVVGPVGIIHLVGEAAKVSIFSVLSFAALISINLGIVNLLPIPALDGGRLLFLIFEGISGKPVNPEREGFIHLVGFILLMMLMIFIVYKDINRFDLF
ncbi:RIP metalloprotease RseP [Thermotalea metallivorans]|uniref:Zinc metalloprotease n=1 Tax=Thermotalea metallivorans TaxID=520762 RepID=A0A140L5G3_9FIRM|nr:RIP metalloprotease RseP [Thermotalea metallivorans]KXG75788.1 Regulator of sigma-W protease RasP [Thermotalea metallivorans]